MTVREFPATLGALKRGGYRIAADSVGTSLLVLPVEYSHCLRAELTSTGATPPRLDRENAGGTVKRLGIYRIERDTLTIRSGGTKRPERFDARVQRKLAERK